MPDEKSVPNIDAENTKGNVLSEVVIARLDSIAKAIEASGLDANADIHNSNLADRTQHRRIRWIAIALSVLVILGLSCLLYHLTHSVFVDTQERLPDSVLVAMFVTPIIAITTITVFLLIGAFRKFKDKDLDNIPVSNIARETNRYISS